MHTATIKQEPVDSMPHRLAAYFSHFADMRGGWIAGKLYIIVTAAGLGYIAKMFDGAPEIAQHDYLPVIVSTAGVIILSLLGFISKLITTKMSQQTHREDRHSNELSLVIDKLEKAAVEKDKNHQTALALKDTAHAHATRELEARYETREIETRKDRHKFRNRTTLCMSRLDFLYTAGKISKDEATINFEKLEANNALSPLTPIHESEYSAAPPL